MPSPLEPPDIEEKDLLARYPFLPQTREWLNNLSIEQNITLSLLIEDPYMEPARKRGRLRLIEMITHSGGVEMQSMSDIHTQEGQLMEAYSYIFAKLIVCSSGDEILLSRWAVCMLHACGVEKTHIQLLGFNAKKIGPWSGLNDSKIKQEKLIWMKNILEELGYDI